MAAVAKSAYSVKIMLMSKWGLWTVGVTVAVAGLLGGLLAVAYADSSLQSAHYHLDEGVIGGGGLIESASPNYTSSSSIGDAAIGNTSSANYQINAGSETPKDPALSFSITSPDAGFTDFSPTSTATATAQFQVSDYTSYGYTVQILGNPPSYRGHTIPAMSTTGPPQTGTEQFGINLVHNTSPTSFGADPDHGQFGVGSPTADYAAANNFRYVDGETIASAPKSSGVTTYTISYIVNVTSVTPGGSYTSNQQLVCTGTY